MKVYIRPKKLSGTIDVVPSKSYSHRAIIAASLADGVSEIKNVKSDTQELKNKVTEIELHIENVTDKNIQTVAEGHLDLSRKFDDVIKVENEKELLVIKVRILEDELRKIKERLDQIA